MPGVLVRTFALLGSVSLCACGNHGPTSQNDGSNPYGLTETGPGVLSVSPLDTLTVYAASPLGKLSPPGHTLPTDHVYINFVDAWSGNVQANDCSKRPVYAAGAGVVTFILVTETAGDTKVEIQMTKTFHYYYDHVLLAPGIAVGTRVDAGQAIATTTGRCPSIDLGVYDIDVALPGLVNPARYGDATRHTASPYRYFTPQLRDFYLSKSRVMEGVPHDPYGRIDFGVAGRLAGDWFHSSLPADPNSSSGPAGWPKSISFARDWYDGRTRVSVGGTISAPFYAGVGPTDPDPTTVTMSTGLVSFQVTLPGASTPHGWLLVQLTAADRIKVEFFAPGARPAAFTMAAQEYLR